MLDTIAAAFAGDAAAQERLAAETRRGTDAQVRGWLADGVARELSAAALAAGADLPLQRLAAAALGNLCVGGDECQQVVADGATAVWLAGLAGDDTALRATSVGALRNAAISPGARALLVAHEGFVPRIAGFLSDEIAAVEAQCLAIARLLVTGDSAGEAAQQLLAAEGCLARIIDHAKVVRLVRLAEGRSLWPQIEACRVLARLCAMDAHVAAVADAGAMPVLAGYLPNATHDVLAKEALEALRAMAAAAPALPASDDDRQAITDALSAVAAAEEPFKDDTKALASELLARLRS